jgi:hypothetical protein
MSERTFDPRVMALRGRIGAHVTHSRHDPRSTTANARATFASRFEAEADPTYSLSEEERARRAHHLRRAHMAKLALLSAQARRRKKGVVAAQTATTPSEVDDAAVRSSKR